MIISAGGTGGHIYPALAIVDKFNKEDKNFEVLYIGTHNRMENDIVPKRNIPYKSLTIYGFSKTMIKRDIKNIGYVYKAYKDAIKIIQEDNIPLASMLEVEPVVFGDGYTVDLDPNYSVIA